MLSKSYSFSCSDICASYKVNGKYTAQNLGLYIIQRNQQVALGEKHESVTMGYTQQNINSPLLKLSREIEGHHSLKARAFTFQLIITKTCMFVSPEPHFFYGFPKLTASSNSINCIIFPHILTRPPNASAMSWVLCISGCSLLINRQKQQLHLEGFVLQVICPCPETRVFF